MRAAVNRIDVIGEGEDLLVIRIVVLHRNFDGQVIFRSRSFFKIYRLGMKNVLVLVEMLDEFGDAALIEEFVFLFRFGTLVSDRDPDAFIEESLLGIVVESRSKLKSVVVKISGSGLNADPPGAASLMSRFYSKGVTGIPRLYSCS